MLKHPLAVALCAALAVSALPVFAQSTAATSATPAASAQRPADNPLFVESTLDLQYPHFDRIQDAHFAPAFDAGMAENLREIEAIAGLIRKERVRTIFVDTNPPDKSSDAPKKLAAALSADYRRISRVGAGELVDIVGD